GNQTIQACRSLACQGCDDAGQNDWAFAPRAALPFDRLRANGFLGQGGGTRPFRHMVEAEDAGVRAEVPFAAPCSAQGASVESG
ncbi:MAG: hypothetical protein KBC94_28740, partial [Pseudacidovorax sp.]|uniref:hypothetical protein n=1 Tax=Pseudacidovorax sp. TaxID=1934311 RepID=UPI001B4B22F1